MPSRQILRGRSLGLGFVASVLSGLCIAFSATSSPLYAAVVYQDVGGEIILDDATYTCASQQYGQLECSPCIVATNTHLGIHMLPRSFIQSCGVDDACHAWFGTLSGSVRPRLTIDGILISNPSLIPEGAYWESRAVRYWHWCPWDGTPSCQGFDCRIDIQIGSQQLGGGPYVTEDYLLQLPTADYSASGIPFSLTFCNQGFSWGVGCNVGGSVANAWKLVAPAPIRAQVIPLGETPFTSFGGTDLELRFIYGPGGTFTVSMIPGAPPAVALPPSSLPRYWEINGEMPAGAFSGEVRISYDPGEIPQGVDPASLEVLRYAEEIGQWVPLPTTLDIDAHVVVAKQIHGLSKLAIGATSTLLRLPLEGNPIGGFGEVPTVASGITYEWGSLGSGAYLGPGSEVRYPAAGNIDASTGTIEFWIKPRWNGNDGQDHYALAIGLSGGILIGKDANSFWRIILNRFGGAGGPELGAGFFVNSWIANYWHHVAFTWGPAAIKVYIDGQLRATEVPPAAPPPVSASDLQLGGDGVSSYLDAVIDEVRINSVERSAEDINSSFNWWVTAVEGSSEEAPGSGLRLGPVFPNPASSSAALVFELGKAGSVRVEVVDVHGRRVRTLVDGMWPAGRQTVSWDGTSGGKEVGSGVYWLVGTHAGKRVYRKMVLVR